MTRNNMTIRKFDLDKGEMVQDVSGYTGTQFIGMEVIESTLIACTNDGELTRFAISSSEESMDKPVVALSLGEGLTSMRVNPFNSTYVGVCGKAREMTVVDVNALSTIHKAKNVFSTRFLSQYFFLFLIRTSFPNYSSLAHLHVLWRNAALKHGDGELI